VRRVLCKTADENGSLDYIFNNAGISVAGEISDLSMEHWEKVIRTNLIGTLHGTTEAYRIMIAQGGGHIVNISSLAGPQHKLQDGFSWSLHAMICKRNEQFRGPWADAEI
jgi:NAD(P)-dependent dehydrogenase (short-subunit alcohol dehydrogenase family)